LRTTGWSEPPVAAFDIHRQTNRYLFLFHAVKRTLLVTACWYLFPTQRFTVIPAVIVAVYAVTIVALEQRWRALNAPVGHQRDVARV